MSEIVIRSEVLHGDPSDDPNPNAWKALAACRGMDPDLWFPNPGTIPHEALRICGECPVQVECGEAGRTEKHGVWGGVTQREVRRRKRVAKIEAKWLPLADPCTDWQALTP